MSARASERWLLIFLSVACAVPLLIIAFGSLHMRYIYEDYCMAYGPSSYLERLLQLPQTLLQVYNNHSGTLTGAVFHYLIPPPNLIGFSSFLILLVWFSVSFIAVRKIVSHILPKAPYLLFRSLVVAGLIVSGTISSTYNINHTFYWYIALTPYIIPIILISLNGTLVLSISKLPFIQIIAFILSFLAGATSHSFIVFQIVLLTLLMAVFWRTDKRASVIAGFLGTLVSFLFVLLAPGNIVRASAYQPDLAFALSNSVYLLGQPLVFILRRTPLILLGCALITAIYAYYYAGQLSRLPMHLIYVPFATLCAAGSAFFPGLYIIGGLPPGWTWVIPIWITLCGVMAFGYLCGLAIRKGKPPLGYLPRRMQIVMAMLAVGILLNGAPIALNAVNRQAAYAAAWDARDAYLKTQAGSTVTVRARSFHGAFDLEDLTNDPNYWTNACIAHYYNLPAILPDDQPPFVP